MICFFYSDVFLEKISTYTHIKRLLTVQTVSSIMKITSEMTMHQQRIRYPITTIRILQHHFKCLNPSSTRCIGIFIILAINHLYLSQVIALSLRQFLVEIAIRHCKAK